MSVRVSELASRGPRRRRALAVALAGCALLLSDIAAATAKTDHVKKSSQVSAPSASPTTTTTTATTTEAAAGTSGEAPESTSGTATTSKGTPSKDAAKAAPASKDATTSKGTASKDATKATASTPTTSKDATKAASTSTGATSKDATKGATKGATKSKPATTAKGTTTSKGQAKRGSTSPADKGPAVVQPAVTMTQPDATGNNHEREKRAREREKHEREREEEREKRERKRERERTKSHKPPPKGKEGERPAEGEDPAPGEHVTPPGVSAGGARAVAASVSPTLQAPPSAATTGTPPQAVDPAAPVIVGSSAQAVRRRAGHGRSRAAGAIAAASLAARSASVPEQPGGGTPVRSHRTTRPLAGTHGTATAGKPTPLVTTITRIVDVVPTPVRILIGALLALALALAVRSRLAARRARRLERQRGQLLEDVGLLQAALLPVPPARLGPVGTSAAYRPAEGPGAGGDFYDVFALENGQLAVIVGDISGHGRQALPHTALVRFTLRAYLEAGLSPRAAVQTAGAVLEHQLGESFATLVAATYEPRERILTYACAGHPAPVVLGSQAGSQPLEPVTAASAPPIGVGMRTGTRQTVVSLPGRSQACFYTDGVTEARVGAELFGPARLARTLAALGPGCTATELLDSVADEADRRPDDMAACLLSVEGDADAAKVLAEELELGRDETAVERAEQFLAACGVGRDEIAEVMRLALRAVGRGGAAILEVHLSDGAPEVILQRDNVTHLGPRLDRSHGELRLSR
jgi:serine phosphatase RsbU (regulator of sigma subunit)